MAVRQTRIFVPATESTDDWAETLAGRVLRRLAAEFDGRLDWFWFSRYGAANGDIADCDITRIPPHCIASGSAAVAHRSLRFRYAVGDEHVAAFEARTAELIAHYGYAISDFRPYDFVADTGSARFLGEGNASPQNALRRAELVTQFYMATSRLVLDALVGPDDRERYRIERNGDLVQNPRGSSFQSLHHVFCNITNVPTDVYVYRKAGQNVVGFGTPVYPPPAPPGGWDESSAHPIWF